MAVQECDALVQLATVLNRTDEAARLQARADAMRSSMAQLWDEEAHIYTNLFTNGTFYRRISPTSFYAMMAKVSGVGTILPRLPSASVDFLLPLLSLVRV